MSEFIGNDCSIAGQPRANGAQAFNIPAFCSDVSAIGVSNVVLASANPPSTVAANVFTQTIKANSLNTIGRGLRIKAWGVTAANGNNKQVRLLLGATVLVDTTALGANNKPWVVEAEIYRITSATYRGTGGGQANAAIIAQNDIAGSDDLTTDLTLAVELTGATAGTDVTMKGCVVQSF